MLLLGLFEEGKRKGKRTDEGLRRKWSRKKIFKQFAKKQYKLRREVLEEFMGKPYILQSMVSFFILSILLHYKANVTVISLCQLRLI